MATRPILDVHDLPKGAQRAENVSKTVCGDASEPSKVSVVLAVADLLVLLGLTGYFSFRYLLR